jgi:molybdopterin-containing oxidoreductase family membrane subunit
MSSGFRAVIYSILRGSKGYYAWMGLLFVLILIVGLPPYLKQLKYGLIVTAMRDQVSWGFYIANFTFLVGVAAAAVLLVIPAYVYDFKPIKEIVLFGEMMAITAILMCIMFILIDAGRPLYVWHMLPFIGKMAFPHSLLAWDMIVLNGYLTLNILAVGYVLIRLFRGKEYKMSFMWPIVIVSIPWALSIHTVTAFIYNGLVARPFWNASIVAPRFIASALCSGPALMLITFQFIRRASDIDITDRAIFKIAELIAYAMGVNLFLLIAEFYKEFYSGSIHLAPMKYLYFGLHGHDVLVPWARFSLLANVIAFLLLVFPRTRKRFFTMNLACVLVIIGVYIEKGMGLIVPGFVPGPLGEIYEYIPTLLEVRVTAGAWALGALIYTLMLKVAIPIYTGRVRSGGEERYSSPSYVSGEALASG